MSASFNARKSSFNLDWKQEEKMASDVKRKFSSAVMQTENLFLAYIYVKTREKKPSQYDFFQYSLPVIKVRKTCSFFMGIFTWLEPELKNRWANS